jgi:hypothetical protein
MHCETSSLGQCAAATDRSLAYRYAQIRLPYTVAEVHSSAAGKEGDTVSQFRSSLRYGVSGMAAATALCLAIPAYAQTGQQTLASTGQTFGTSGARKIEINAAADATYDSNVLGSRPSTAAQRGLEKDDIIIRPRVEGIIGLPAGPFQLSLSGLVGYDFYTKNSELDSERIDLQASASGHVAACGGAVNGGYSRAQSDLRDLSIEPGDPTTSSINIQTVSRISGNFYCGAAVGLRAVGSVEYRMSRNSNDRRRGSDVNNFSYSGGVMYSSPAFGEVTVFVSKSKFDYIDRDPLLFVSIPDVNVLSGGVRLDRRLGARLQVNGQVTYTEVKVAGRGKQFEGLNWDIAASLRATDSLQISVSTARQIDASTGFRSNYVQASIYSAAIDYAVTQRIRLSLSAQRQERDFDNDLVAPGIGVIDHDKFTRLSGRLSFDRSERLGFSLFTTYEKRTADLDLYDYSGLTAGAGIRIRLGS